MIVKGEWGDIKEVHHYADEITEIRPYYYASERGKEPPDKCVWKRSLNQYECYGRDIWMRYQIAFGDMEKLTTEQMFIRSEKEARGIRWLIMKVWRARNEQ